MIQHTTRPSRTYKDGVGKPVVAKRFDEIVGRHQWMVVFPPVNNFGQRLVVEEAWLCGKADDWCDDMNERGRRTAEQAHGITAAPEKGQP